MALAEKVKPYLCVRAYKSHVFAGSQHHKWLFRGQWAGGKGSGASESLIYFKREIKNLLKQILVETADCLY